MWNSVWRKESSGLVHRKQGSRSDLRPALKEKFVSIYEDIFALKSTVQLKRDEGFSGRQELQIFWDELLLLKVNDAFLSKCLIQASEERLMGPLKVTINDLFSVFLRYLSDESYIRVAHSLETLTILFREILRKRFQEQGYTAVAIISGSPENVDLYFKRLFNSIAALLQGKTVPVLVKVLGIRLILTLLTATEAANSISRFVFVNDISESMVAVLSLDKPADKESILAMDSALLTLLLFLFRDSKNVYLDSVSNSSNGALSLLTTAKYLLSRGALNERARIAAEGFMALETATGGVSSLAGYFGLASMLGYSSSPSAQEDSKPMAAMDLNSEEVNGAYLGLGICFLYFAVYLNPILTSTNVWQQSSPLSAAFVDVFKLFFSLLPEFLCPKTAPSALRAQSSKICLLVLRCFLEGKLSADFFFKSDSASLSPIASLSQDSSEVRTVANVVLDNAVEFVSVSCQEPSSLDPESMALSVTLLAIMLNKIAKSEPKIFSAKGGKWESLWAAIINLCQWCSEEPHFLRSGVPELAQAAVELLESALGHGPSLLTSADDVITLHAAVLARAPIFEALARISERILFSGAQKGVKLANIKELTLHYEVQLAANGVAGSASKWQAMEAVEKKGFHSLRMKAVHAGPSNLYVERTMEVRVFLVFSRQLVSVYKGVYLPSLPKLELEEMG